MSCARIILSLCLVTFVASCGLPRSAPTKSELLANSTEKGGDTLVIPVNNDVIKQVNDPVVLSFPASFKSAKPVNPDMIFRGDMLTLEVYENVDNGVFGSFGSGGGFGGLRVDQDGMIFVPYVGRIKAAGKLLEQLRGELTETLGALTPEPQVRLFRAEGPAGASVTIFGTASSGLFPIDPVTLRLSPMLTVANAVGSDVDPVSVRVSVKRGNQEGEIFLSDLYEDDSNNIALRPGDRISIQKDERKFMVLGALGGRGIVTFPEPEFSILEALSFAGGLDSSISDPKGIFILRNEDENFARKVAGPDVSISGPTRVVYTVDLTKPDGLFIAREFMMKDNDTILVTEAPFTQWTKAINAILSTTTTAQNLTTIGQ